MAKRSDKSAKVVMKVLFYLLCIAMGLWVGTYVASSTEGGYGNLILYLIGGVAAVLLALLVQIIVHELGHLLAGLAGGWRFLAFRVLSVMLVRSGGKLRLTNFNIPGTAGQCLMSPPERPAAECRLTLYNAGGFAANIILAIVALALFVACHDGMGFFAQAFVLSLVATGLVLALQNGVPMLVGGTPNDGLNLRLLRRDPASARHFVGMLRCNALTMQGVRLKDMPDDIFALDDGDDRSSSLVQGTMFARLCRALDALDLDAAQSEADALAALGDDLPAIYAGELHREQLFLSLVMRGGGGEAERLYDKHLRDYLKAMSAWQLSSLRVMYAYALLHDRDEQAAVELRARFDRKAAGYFSPADAESERDLMRLVDERRADGAQSGHEPSAGADGRTGIK